MTMNLILIYNHVIFFVVVVVVVKKKYPIDMNLHFVCLLPFIVNTVDLSTFFHVFYLKLLLLLLLNLFFIFFLLFWRNEMPDATVIPFLFNQFVIVFVVV